MPHVGGLRPFASPAFQIGSARELLGLCDLLVDLVPRSFDCGALLVELGAAGEEGGQ
jgi:hypothetical protein